MASRSTYERGTSKQPIVGFERDEEGYWVVHLVCGHGQHMRHDPPWQLRPWTETEAGRASKIGMVVERLKNDRDDPVE